MMKLSISEITIDPEIQLKARQTDRETVGAYVEAMTNGDQFPPVTVFCDEDGTNWLAGGFHRVAAAQFLGLDEIEADIHEGSKQDAMVFAALDNTKHGRPMSNKQKREAAERLFELREDLSDREIGRLLAVTGRNVSYWHNDFDRENAKNFASYVIPESPTLFVACAENMPQVESESIDIIITSPPYNLGNDNWPMGGNGRTPREGIGYQDQMPEDDYQAWQIECLKEIYRVAKPGASLFYNHKVRNQDGQIIHPMDWLRASPWLIRQEIIWDRRSTHNHSPTLFWPEDERIYWMTKGKPTLPDGPIGMSSVWEFHGPRVNTWHPAPFPEELPRRCMEALGRDGITVLDPFAGSCSTLKVALEFGYQAIGVDTSEDYLIRACIENGWVEGISRGVAIEGPIQVPA